MNTYICENSKFKLDENNEYRFLKPQIIKNHKDLPINQTYEIPDNLVDPETNEMLIYQTRHQKF